MARAAEVLLEQVDSCVQTAVEFGEEVHLGRGDWAYPWVVFSYLSDVFGGVCKLSRPQAVVFFLLTSVVYLYCKNVVFLV